MKLSWSHILFLNIQKRVGKNPQCDRIMVFCAKWLIWIMGILMAALFIYEFGLSSDIKGPRWVWMLFWTGVDMIIGIFFSYVLAIFIRRKRPYNELDNVKNLIEPLTPEKSFPSDHALLSFIMAGVVGVTFPFFWWGLLFVLLALLVSFGRVYVGVHYPRDVIAGALLALLVVYGAPYLLF